VLKVEEPGCSNPVSQSSPILDALSNVAANVAASAAKPMIDPQNDEEDPSQLHLSQQCQEEQASSSTSTSPDLSINSSTLLKLFGEVGIKLDDVSGLVERAKQKVEEFDAQISSKEEIIETMKAEISSLEREVCSLKRKREECDAEFVEFEKIQKKLESCDSAQTNIPSSHSNNS